MLVTILASGRNAAHRHRLAGAVCGCLLAALGSTGSPAFAAGPGPDRFERATVTEINKVRAARGLRPLSPDRRLARVSDAHSARMAGRGVFAHSTGSLVRRVGARHVGEVIAWVRGPGGRVYRDEAARIVRGWMASAPHRVMLLRPRYRRVGVARRRGGGGTSYYTATLASRP